MQTCCCLEISYYFTVFLATCTCFKFCIRSTLLNKGNLCIVISCWQKNGYPKTPKTNNVKLQSLVIHTCQRISVTCLWLRIILLKISSEYLSLLSFAKENLSMNRENVKYVVKTFRNSMQYLVIKVNNYRPSS